MFAAVLISAAAALAGAGAASAASIERGGLLFLRCASCHDISDKPSQKTGPSLAGVYGRRAGSLPGYTYSAAMKGQDFIWNDEMLDRWLARPADLVPGTAMAFAGMDNKIDREALIAYLRTQGPHTPVPGAPVPGAPVLGAPVLGAPVLGAPVK